MKNSAEITQDIRDEVDYRWLGSPGFDKPFEFDYRGSHISSKFAKVREGVVLVRPYTVMYSLVPQAFDLREVSNPSVPNEENYRPHSHPLEGGSQFWGPRWSLDVLGGANELGKEV